MVDDSGVPQHESFDSFGQRRDAAHWQAPPATADVTNDRAVTNIGYTGQEELDDLGLVHMNGRVYEPMIGRFLSVDPVYQAPTNSQSVNPYSYVMNNPLSLTDPSGYCTASEGSGKTEQCQTTGNTHESAMTGTHIRGHNSGIKGADLKDLKSAQVGRLLTKLGDTISKYQYAFGEKLTTALNGLKDTLQANILGSGKDGGQTADSSQKKPATGGDINSPANMHLSADGQEFLKGLEGDDDGGPLLKARDDIAGNSTIGWGHKLQPGDKDEITVEQAQTIFNKDVGVAESSVVAAISVRMTQNQFDALVAVAFNVGSLGAAAPKLVADMNSGHPEKAVTEINFRYYHDKGGNLKVSPGLENRSAAERDYFQNGPNPP